MEVGTPVARSARAWIETLKKNSQNSAPLQSHALRVRGLKHFFSSNGISRNRVARSARAWIETYNRACSPKSLLTSHALRVRGLKLLFEIEGLTFPGRTLCACVD